jgi:hypothetical protein
VGKGDPFDGFGVGRAVGDVNFFQYSNKDLSNHLRYKMPKEDGKIKWYLRPISVVLLLFFVLGPFALPLLYKSPKFSKTSRIILTIVVIIYTSFLIFASLEIGRELYIRMEELRGILEQI